MPRFLFSLCQKVNVSAEEHGEIIGRAEFVTSEPRYLVRYVNGQGCLTETWWDESALTSANKID